MANPDPSSGTRFRPGQSGNPHGRPKGSRNRLASAFVEALASDFEEHGRDVIATVRQRHPAAYLRIASGLLPKELSILDETAPDRREDGLDMSVLTEDELRTMNRIIGKATRAGSAGACAPQTVADDRGLEYQPRRRYQRMTSTPSRTS